MSDFSILIIFSIIIGLILTGCTATEVGTAKWATGGALAGAAGGALFGHHEKAIYAGAAAGAATSGLIGYLRNKDKTRYCRYYDSDRFPYDAPCGKP
ncbi:hypothetical protein [uncultured Bartonella sp.]|uniref:hypothetical protein n=1 Tax=uncultured Bartonella sp. TaxID=104108 RepID=UPI00263771A4|nr:hypothetical protein [uncultured Bartonella sp.]